CFIVCCRRCLCCCYLYCGLLVVIFFPARRSSDLSIVILYVNCVRSCCKIIINKCPGVSSTIYLVGVGCNTSGHGSNSDRSICCSTRCIAWGVLYRCGTISLIDRNRCRKYTSILIL